MTDDPHGDGAAAIRVASERFYRAFESLDPSEMRFTITDVRAEVRGSLGWVHCTENILSETRGSLAITAILATNVFERQTGRWLVAHHHASHILAPQGAGPGAA